MSSDSVPAAGSDASQVAEMHLLRRDYDFAGPTHLVLCCEGCQGVVYDAYEMTADALPGLIGGRLLPGRGGMYDSRACYRQPLRCLERYRCLHWQNVLQSAGLGLPLEARDR